MMHKNGNILVTGCAGFIGSNFVEYFLQNNDAKVIGLDSLTYAGNIQNLNTALENNAFHFIEGNIRNRDLINYIFKNHSIKYVVNFAAETHVDNSITAPNLFIKTNINGTFNLLECAYKNWMEGPFSYKKDFSHAKFMHISTDEVYGSLGPTGFFSETSPYAPNSPYSASKAGSDMIVRSYHETYGLNTLTTNCSNNYGPKQHSEKLIPNIINSALTKNEIPIYGNGQNIRDWLYVFDHCKAIDLVLKRGASGEVYNIGGSNEKTNLEVAYTICEILDKKRPSKMPYSKKITFVDDRAGHDQRYAIDANKIKCNIGWVPDENFKSGILKTINWYLENKF